jgi:triacylglycerol lipase
MSIFVEFDQSVYRGNAIDAFTANSAFSLDNARAMMWLSQLAYETAHEDKVTNILNRWTLTKRKFISNDPGTGLPPHSACVVVAEGRGAMFVTFAGSDPGKGVDWVTDFEAMPSPDDLHSGFDAAVGTVWPAIQPVIESRAAGEPVFFTGHSLGGALAILAAMRAAKLQNPPTIVVYTFGSPRNGGFKFFSDYTPLLGDTTFRLIHGNDIVPTVPPTLIDVYHHVGRAIQCASGGLFDPSTIMPREGNKPDLIESAITSGVSAVAAAALLRPFQPIGPGLRNLLASFLPGMIRDHVPTNYFRALSITVP